MSAFSLSTTIARNGSWLAGIEAGCERLVSAEVTDDEERGSSKRLVGLLLAAPFVIAPAIAPALAAVVSGPLLLAATCAVFAFVWITAAIAASGVRRGVEPVLLCAGVVATATAVAGGGGFASPAALLAVALVFEPWWVEKSRSRLIVGSVAAAVALSVSVVAVPAMGSSWLTGSIWVWLAPAFYSLVTLPRIIANRPRAGETQVVAESLDQQFDAAVLKLSRNGEVIDATAAAGQLFALPGGLLTGRSLFERVHVADRVALMNALANFEAGETGPSLELNVRVRDIQTTDAEERFVLVTLEPLRLQAGGELTLLVREVTELAGLRSELAAAREAAESIEVAKSRFLAAVSHELRTPLNAIIGFSDMMLNDLAGSLADRQREYIGMISQSGHHLLSVVNAILDVSKIESGAYGIRPEPFVVIDAVDLCGSMMAQQAEENGLDLNVTVRPGVSELVADRRAVQQIIINLLTNAIKFTPEGGSVSLEVYRLGSTVSFVVTDTGIGIEKDDLSKLGQPFTQLSNDVSRQFEGAGLGLSLVKGLVALHGGGLEISSEIGEGTEVKVTLPVDGPEQQQEEPQLAAQLPRVQPTLRMEDEKVRKTA
ncbi:MAG: HAMP domain-containing histidine kinase [Rhizobiaceae bacterium]|nr:HAMP domain-containing histidine kinase [Rhizobiaceae bacterium]